MIIPDRNELIKDLLIEDPDIFGDEDLRQREILVRSLATPSSKLEFSTLQFDTLERLEIQPLTAELTVSDELRLFALIDRANARVAATIDLPSARTIQLLIQLNARSSRQASAKDADLLALKYAQSGLKLLGTAGWQQNYHGTLLLHELAIAAAARCSELELMHQWIECVSRHVPNPTELVEICIVKMQSSIELEHPLAAIRLGRSMLERLGVRLPVSPTTSDFERAMADIDALPQASTLPELSDLHQLAIVRVATKMMRACYAIEPHLYALVVALQVKLAIEHGTSSSSAYSFAAYAIVLNKDRQVTSAERFSRLAYELAIAQPSHWQSRTFAAIGLFLKHRTAHLRETIPIFQTGAQAGLATNGLADARYNFAGLVAATFWCGEDLSQQLARLTVDEETSQQQLSSDRCKIYERTLQFLLGTSVDRPSLTDPDPLLICEDLDRIFIVHLHSAVLALLMGESSPAAIEISNAQKFLSAVVGSIYEVNYYFYDSLIALTDRDEVPERVRANQQQLAKWAASAPMNYLHKWQLVAAEICRICGDRSGAIEYYDLAIAGALANDYLQEAALANELAGQFYRAWNKEPIAAEYLRSAHRYYLQWGAIAKLHNLATTYPQLFMQAGIPVSDRQLPVESKTDDGFSLGALRRLESFNLNYPTATPPAQTSNFDFNTYIRSVEALSSEIDLDRLLQKLMDVVLEHAGADKAALLLSQDGNLTIALEYDRGELDTLDFDLHSFDRDYRLPLFLIRHVHQTQNIEIYDGDNHPYLTKDPYFEEHRSQSILCLPILNQSKAIGILYLENYTSTEAFTPDRVELLNVICTQAAISLENARLHQESQAYARQLEQSLQERQQFEQQLQVTNERLLQSNRLKDQFLANMSHELRTPLNAVLGMTEGLKEGVFGAISPEQGSALDTIATSGAHLLSLINDVLELAKIEAGQLELHPAPTAIVPLCESSLAFIRQQAFHKQIRVDVKFQPNLPDLFADERRIRQVLINLLSNAVKFTPPGGQIDLSVVYLATGEANDSAPSAGTPQVRIEIADTGIGISPDNLKKLFQPFVQIDGALNRHYEGTGLGLALVKRIVDLHGGKVGASSELGLGSSFTVDLPCPTLPTQSIEVRNSPPIELPAIVPRPSDRPPLILLAEDNPANVHTMSSYLKAKGYRIILADDGSKAIDLAKSTQPDVILMDIQMPIVDGLTAIGCIRKFSDVPIIALTALAMTSDFLDQTLGDRELCLEAGADEYLAKPVKLKQLTLTIDRLMAARQTLQLSALPSN